MKTNMFCLAFMLLALACAAKHDGSLTEYPVYPEQMTKFYDTNFRGDNTISLINDQNSTDEFLISIQGSNVVISPNTKRSQSYRHGEDWQERKELVGNLRSWTETAISVLRKELEKKGFKVTPNAKKKIDLAITKEMEIIPVATTFLRCILHLKVETGGGYQAEFEGNNMSYDRIENVLGGSVILAVGEMLNDDRILAYLGGSEGSSGMNTDKESVSPKTIEKRKAYTISEVSKMLGVSEPTIKAWIADGELKATKIGSTWLIPSSEIEKIANPSK